MSTDEIPERRHPAFIAVGFGLDESAALSLTNLAGSAVNSTELPDVPRPRPIEGIKQAIDAATTSPSLRDLPLVVRDEQARTRLLELLGTEATARIRLITEVETAALEQTRTPPDIWGKGETRRTTPQQDDSMDEARVISGRLFYALNGLSVGQRQRVLGH